MPVSCVVGLQWGDEGKGKIIDRLAPQAEVVVRFQGGANAGHTVQVGRETFILHLVPSGILHPGTACVIASGVVLDPVVLVEEIEGLEARGVDVDARLQISDRAHLVLPYHRALDRAREQRAVRAIGTTARGIGPAYADKASRTGIRAGEMADPAQLAERVRAGAEQANLWLTRIWEADPLDVDQVVATVAEAARRLAPHVTDTTGYLLDALDSDRRIFLEGAQGVMLDIDHGTYPFVTSSSASAAGAAPGTGLPPSSLREVLGVAKAYVTRVGAGPFPTEITGEEGDRLRQAGAEFGSTTGRPRRCGWFDAVAARYGVRVMGVTGLAITKLDVLSGLQTLKVAVSYRRSDQGGDLTSVPADLAVLERVEPVYTALPGFAGDVSGVRRRADLPGEARDYLAFLEQELRVPVRLISVGKERDQVIES